MGLVLLYLFAEDVGQFQIFPGIGSYLDADSLPDKAWSLFLPWLVLSASFAAIYARYMRSGLIEAMEEDYIRTARAKGLSERRVILKHGVRSAMTPIVTLLGLDVAILLAGNAILTESVFNIPGVGRLVFTAIERSDLPVIQGVVLFGAFFIIILNLLVDIAYAYLDPTGEVRMSEALLEVEDLRVQFETDDGIVKAVDGVSFSVERGRTLGIVGESGSGKSVANLTVLGLTRAPNATITGSVRFGGRDLLELDHDGPALGPRQRDRDDLPGPALLASPLLQGRLADRRGGPGAPRRLQERGQQRAIDLLREVGIPSPETRINDYPHEFSGGMRQRAMIAMALVNEPALLIADEPTTALDVTTQAQILALLQRLQDQHGMAVVLITHDLGVVAENAEEIAVMYAGRIVEHADAGELFAAPQHPYTWGLLRSIPSLTGPAGEELHPISGLPPSLIHVPERVLLPPPVPLREAAARRGRAGARAGRRP